MRLPQLILAGLLLSCGQGEVRPHAEDDHELRLLSLGGNLTESVHALGRGDLLVGVDSSSYYPASMTSLPQVGYHRAFSAEGAASLKPSLVLHTEQAGPPVALEQLGVLGIETVEIRFPDSTEGAFASLRQLGEVLDASAEAEELVASIEQDLATLRELVAADSRRPGVLFLYGRGAGPMMIAGEGTGASYMVELAGGRNLATGFHGFKPFSNETLVELDPEYLVLLDHGMQSLGGLDAVMAMPGVAETTAGRTGGIVALDDLKLLGFGPRMGEGALELFHALHPAKP